MESDRFLQSHNKIFATVVHNKSMLLFLNTTIFIFLLTVGVRNFTQSAH